MRISGEPKSTNFLLPTQDKKSPSVNPEQTIVRSGEARQESQKIDGDLIRLKGFARNMKSNPTPAENFLHNFLIEKKIPHKMQKLIYPYIVDFLFLQKGLIIEVDGGIHNNLNQMTYDLERDSQIMKLKLIIFRFTNEEIFKNSNKILQIYSQLPNKNTNKLGYFIAYHNKNCGREFNLSIPYFKKYFAKVLGIELARKKHLWKFPYKKRLREYFTNEHWNLFFNELLSAVQ